MAYSFASGPARLPDAVLQRARETLFVRGSDGAAAVERPFSSPIFHEALHDTQDKLRQLLGVPDGHEILFLAGGAMHQFAMLPANLVPAGGVAGYAISGYWAARAAAEAAKLVHVRELMHHDGDEAVAVPPLDDWELAEDLAYCHLTPNETADGLAFDALPEARGVPLVADCTSCFLARVMPVDRFGLIYAAAQKNAGIAGVTIVIVRRDLLERSPATLPAVHSYRLQSQDGSCVNTPPATAIHILAMVCDWIIEQGGVAEMQRRNEDKAGAIYGVIDGSAGFYCAPVAPEYRSTVNICFHCQDRSLDALFVSEAEEQGLHHLGGHSRLGGMRASLYNGMPREGADALVDFMREFKRRHG